MFNGLFDAGYKELKRVEKIANKMIEARDGNVKIESGGGGNYGKVK